MCDDSDSLRKVLWQIHFHLHEGCTAYTISMAEEFQTFAFWQNKTERPSSLRDCGDLIERDAWTSWFKMYNRINVMYHCIIWIIFICQAGLAAACECTCPLDLEKWLQNTTNSFLLKLLTGCRFGVLGFLATLATLGWTAKLLWIKSTCRHLPTSWLPFLCCQLEVFFLRDLHAFQLLKQNTPKNYTRCIMIHAVSFKLPCPGDQTLKFRLTLGFPHGASKSQKNAPASQNGWSHANVHCT